MGCLLLCSLELPMPLQRLAIMVDMDVAMVVMEAMAAVMVDMEVMAVVMDMERGQLKPMLSQDTMVDMDVAMVAMEVTAAVMVDMVVIAVVIVDMEVLDMERGPL